MRTQRGPGGQFSSLYGTTTLRLKPDFPYPPGGPRYERLLFDANDQLIVPLNEWYHLLDLCALVDTLIADADGLYHPGVFNDRLLLGLKGTMSEALCGRPHKASYADLRIMPTCRPGATAG